MNRPRPLNAEASLGERLRHLEIAIFGDDENPPEPEYIDTTARIAGESAIVPAPEGSMFDRLQQLEQDNARLRQAITNMTAERGR